MKAIELIRKSRKAIYTAFVISTIGMLGHELDFTWIGWAWCIAALTFGGLTIVAQQAQNAYEENNR